MGTTEIQMLMSRQDDIFKLLEKHTDKLTAIEIQTTKTNGRVTRLEERHNDCPIKHLDSIIELEKNPLAKKKNTIGTAVLFVLSVLVSVALILGIFQSLKSVI